VRGYITALVGMAGTAKSYLLLAFAIAAITGKPWCGMTVNRVRRMLYVDCELDSETFWRRAFEVSRGFGLSRPPKGLRYLCLTGVSLASAEGWQRVDDARRRYKVNGICVDSITIGSLTISMNDPAAVNRLFGSFELWGVPVFAIDHLGKDPRKGATGSFMKYAKIRSEITLQAVRRGLISFTHSKTNFGAQLEPFQVVSSFVGGQDGTPLVVSFTAAASAGPTPPVPPHTPSPTRLLAPAAGPATLPSPIPLPILTPPASPGDTTASPILAWLNAQGDTTLPIPSRVIYAAMALQGLPLRACKMALKRLFEEGRVIREGQANTGYLYRLGSHDAPET
jgi:hypothetical protein